MAAGIIQWYVRSLPPPCSPLPIQSAEAKLGIPARLDSDSCVGFDTGRRRIQGSCFKLKGSLPFTRASHLPCRGVVVIRIYNCQSGQYLCSVQPAETSIFDFLTTNLKPGLSRLPSKWSSPSRLFSLVLFSCKLAKTFIKTVCLIKQPFPIVFTGRAGIRDTITSSHLRCKWQRH